LVSEHDNDAFTSVAQFGKTTTDQLAADLTTLMVGQDGHRSQ
jgi:hypothetical protein